MDAAVLRSSRAGCFALLCSALLASGCSVMVDANRTQCIVDADCRAFGSQWAESTCVESFCKPSPRWACLDTPLAAPPVGRKFHVVFFGMDTVTQQPRPGFSARLCNKRDLTCEAPVSEVLVGSADGRVTFEVPSGFDGYARFDGDDLYPVLYFFNPPVSADLPQVIVSLGTPAAVAGLTALTGLTQDAERGVVLTSLRDCTGAPAKGVKLAITPEGGSARTFYSQAGLPSSSAMATDVDGYGGFMNVDPGLVTVSATLPDGRASDTITVLVQAGAQTMASLVPHG